MKDFYRPPLADMIEMLITSPVADGSGYGDGGELFLNMEDEDYEE